MSDEGSGPKTTEIERRIRGLKIVCLTYTHFAHGPQIETQSCLIVFLFVRLIQQQAVHHILHIKAPYQ